MVKLISLKNRAPLRTLRQRIHRRGQGMRAQSLSREDPMRPGAPDPCAAALEPTPGSRARRLPRPRAARTQARALEPGLPEGSPAASSTRHGQQPPLASAEEEPTQEARPGRAENKDVNKTMKKQTGGAGWADEATLLSTAGPPVPPPSPRAHRLLSRSWVATLGKEEGASI